MLETKKGKTVALAGQDVSAHVGHEVKVKGTWESGMSATSSSNSGSSGKTFNVTEVKMVSDTCGGKSQSGSMDHSSGSTSGTSTAGSSVSPVCGRRPRSSWTGPAARGKRAGWKRPEKSWKNWPTRSRVKEMR